MNSVPLSEKDPLAVLRPWGEPDGEIRPAMLIFAGGAYQALSPAESEVSARYYTQHGYRCFIVDYSIKEQAVYPEPLLEVSRAVWQVRSHAELYGIDPEKIVLVGYSAGAHLVTMAAALWNHPVSRAGTDVPEGGNRISATVTGYTPTTFEDFFDKLYLLKPFMSEKDYEFQKLHGGPYALMNPEHDFFHTVESLTCTRHINAQTPPAFLWQTTKDAPGFAWDYAAELKKYGTEFELHYFSDDERCVAMRFDPEYTDKPLPVQKNTLLWPEMSLNFLNRVLNP